MLVYHGTIHEMRKPIIIKNEIGRDFGFAFYTTDIKAKQNDGHYEKLKLKKL